MKELLAEGSGWPRCSWYGEDEKEMAKGYTGYQTLLFKATKESHADRELE